MLERTNIPEAPWWIIEADDKKRARLNCISHLLTQIPYQEIEHPEPVLPQRVHNPNYLRGPEENVRPRSILAERERES